MYWRGIMCKAEVLQEQRIGVLKCLIGRNIYFLHQLYEFNLWDDILSSLMALSQPSPSCCTFLICSKKNTRHCSLHKIFWCVLSCIVLYRLPHFFRHCRLDHICVDFTFSGKSQRVFILLAATSDSLVLVCHTHSLTLASCVIYYSSIHGDCSELAASMLHRTCHSLC